ncbi:MAG: peptidoglycan D,D-transpeptidase FtsI family protein [Bacteroidota bacterium]
MPIEARRLFALLVAGFALLSLGLGVIQFARLPALVGNPQDPRLVRVNPVTRRGGIHARDGEVISAGPAPLTRLYPVASLCHTVGYADPRFGASGLEAAYDEILSGRNPRAAWPSWLAQVLGGQGAGAELTTTIALPLQRAAADALGGRRGAVVVLDAAYGDVLALVSQPGFRNPPTAASWRADRARTDGPFLNRALQGLYPPGSTFKLVTAAAALDAGLEGYATDCRGRTIADGRLIREDGAGHGRVDLAEALVKSCNIYFARLGTKLGPRRLAAKARAMGLGAAPPFDLGTAAGSLAVASPGADLAETAIGQGRTLVTPLQMALIAAAVVNGGRMPRPRLVRSIRYSAADVEERRPRIWRRALTPSQAQILREALLAAVRRGTGRRAAARGLLTGGKTGTAEAPGGRPHAWFVGFALRGEDQLAIAVVVEHAGGGGAAAAPIAAAVWRAVAGGAQY